MDLRAHGTSLGRRDRECDRLCLGDRRDVSAARGIADQQHGDRRADAGEAGQIQRRGIGEHDGARQAGPVGGRGAADLVSREYPAEDDRTAPRIERGAREPHRGRNGGHPIEAVKNREQRQADQCEIRMIVPTKSNTPIIASTDAAGIAANPLSPHREMKCVWISPLVLRPQMKKLPKSSQNVRVRATLASTASGSM